VRPFGSLQSGKERHSATMVDKHLYIDLVFSGLSIAIGFEVIGSSLGMR